MSTSEIIRLADGTRTSAEIAAIVGVTPRHVDKIARRNNIVLPKPADWKARGNTSPICAVTFRKMAEAGKFSDEIAKAMGLGVETIRKFSRRNGIPLKKRPPPNNFPMRAPKPAPPPAPRPQSVEEWVAIHGAPKLYEPGTLDQILFDTFASVGKTLTYSAGKGTSWTPYKVGTRNMNLGQVIAAANKIRAEQGKPLLSEPRRKAPSSAAWGKARAA